MLTILLILFPLALSLITFSLREEKMIKTFVLAGSIVQFGIAIAAIVQYKTACHCNLLAHADWLSSMGISLRFGLDGIGLLMVAMTTFLVPLIILSSFSHTYRNPSAFYGLMLLMEMALVGVFSSFDGMMFYIFWEMTLIPAWFICALWGGNDRIRITFKFFVYTFAGSLFMLVALIWVYLRTPAPHSFGFEWMRSALLSPQEQSWIFAAFFLAFAIKIPIFPFHTWQPDTYAESPPAGSMLLAGIMLKMGIFGIIRWLIPLCPDAVQQYGPAAMALGVTGIVYASVIALRQQDLKRLVAYSSIAHVGLIATGVFALSVHSLQGAVIQMVSHGINIVGLFIVIDAIERRTGTRDIGKLGGIVTKAPRLAIFFMIILLASIALPLTNGFVGEFLLLLGIFEGHVVFAMVAGLTIILSAVYMMRMYQRAIFGPVSEAVENIPDLTLTEMLVLIPLVVMILWIGVNPGFFLTISMDDVLIILNGTR